MMAHLLIRPTYSNLDANSLKSTFFIVGSRAISRPDILQAEFMQGHQLSIHTWSHPYLTTLSNEQIIAELGWTKKAIKDITGLTPNTFRPPYGDIDDRVRAILKAMGLTPIMWSNISTNYFDTDDWHIPAGYPVDGVIDNFENILNNASSMDTGFIVLEHDLYQQTVDVAIGYILPDAMARRNIVFKNIIECLHKPLGDAYVETNSNSSNPPGFGATTLTGSSIGSGTNTGTGKIGTSTKTTTSSPTDGGQGGKHSSGAALLSFSPFAVPNTLLIGLFVTVVGSFVAALSI